MSKRKLGAVFDNRRIAGSETNHVLDVGLSTRPARWGRRGVIASLLIGAATLAAKSFSWFRFSPAAGAEYQVIAQWQVPAGGEGSIIAIGPDSSPEQLRELGRRLKRKFHDVDNVVVMIFDDADAAGKVYRGSRIVSETEFRTALAHQRAMYLKSIPRHEESFTIYRAYPAVAEVMRFEVNDLQTKVR
jgi:hypothetical protein